MQGQDQTQPQLNLSGSLFISQGSCSLCLSLSFFFLSFLFAWFQKDGSRESGRSFKSLRLSHEGKWSSLNISHQEQSSKGVRDWNNLFFSLQLNSGSLWALSKPRGKTSALRIQSHLGVFFFWFFFYNSTFSGNICVCLRIKPAHLPSTFCLLELASSLYSRFMLRILYQMGTLCAYKSLQKNAWPCAIVSL